MSPWENLSMGAQRTGLVEGRRCQRVGGRVLFKLCINGCRVFLGVVRRVLFRVGRRVLFRIIRSASLRVVRRVLFMNGRKMFGRRERAELILVLYKGVNTRMADRFLQQSLLKGRSIQAEERKMEGFKLYGR
jgi:hypothetical protein